MSKTRNRGQQSNDHKLFHSKWLPIFQEAVDDMQYLLSKAYGANAALQIVGNRYKLNKRQRQAISRISAPQQAIILRKQKELQLDQIKDKDIAIDGFNLLILLESILSEAYFFKCRDGAYRDISSVHGSYKRVVKTEEAILLVGKTLNDLSVARVLWLLDEPISNSGRLKSMLRNMAEIHGFSWEVELVFNPDKVLIEGKEVVISSDSWVLDEAAQWFNLPAYFMEQGLLSGNCIEV